MKKELITLALLTAVTVDSAQCPVITIPATATLSCNNPVQITASSNYSANIVSRWIGPGNISIASSGSAISVAELNHIGTYTVIFTDTGSSCSTAGSISVSANTNSSIPVFDLSVNTYSQYCNNDTIKFNISNPQTWPTPGGPVTFTFAPVTASLQSGNLSTQFTFSTQLCGVYKVAVRAGSSGCLTSFNVPISCGTQTSPLIYLSPFPASVCVGNSTTVTATGANTYTWNTGVTGSVVVLSPTVMTVYTVQATASNGCFQTAVIPVTASNGCSFVWPGDANYDGQVDNSDVFELGLAANTFGPTRQNASNTYSPQIAWTWSGTGSTGKNRCHVDCDGDGVITPLDTVAIYNNFNISHTFRQSPGAANEISLQNAGVLPVIGGKLQVHLGSTSQQVNQVAGIGFDLNFDQSKIDTAYVIFVPSFLHNSQNIFFRKTIVASGKIHGVTVRTDGISVSGNGTIAEIFIKPKANLSPSDKLYFSLSNVERIDSNGVVTPIQNADLEFTLPVIEGLPESSVLSCAGFYPNPAVREITINSACSGINAYTITDMTGRELASGKFSGTVLQDVTTFVPGLYIISVVGQNSSMTAKLVVE